MAVLITAFLVSSMSLSARTFTSTDGQSIEAEVVKVAGQSVVMKLANGRSVTVPLDRLEESDRAYIAEWAKEAAKNKVPRVKVEIDSNKRDSNVEAGYDERQGSVQFQVNVTNEERGFRIEKATATLVVFGDYLYQKDDNLLMQRVEFKDISFDFDKTYQMKAKEIRYEYDKSGYKYGVKYEGYLFIMKTAAGKVIDISGSSTRVESMAEAILKLNEGDHFNDRYEKIQSNRSGTSTIIR